MSEKKRDPLSYAQRSSALRSSKVFQHIRDRIITNRHSAASSLATLHIPKCVATQISQSKCKSLSRKRLELIHQRFVHRFRQFRWKFSEIVQRYTISIVLCCAQRTSSAVETLKRLTAGKKTLKSAFCCVFN